MSLHVARWQDMDPGVLHDVVKLRVDVFVVEQHCPYPELDGRDVDPTTEHVWWSDDTGVVAYLRVLHEDGCRRIGRVVTREDARGCGLSARLLRDVIGRQGEGPLVLAAQAHLAGFYERYGFAAAGPEYVEDGIPHVPMRRPAGQRLPDELQHSPAR